jgi:hypothetical protein
MPKVLTTSAVIKCPHGGLGTSVPTDPRWKIHSGIVLLDGDMGTLSCPVCIGYQHRSMGLNASLIGSRKVMLTSDFHISFAGFPLTIIETHTVNDQSTPVPVPPGGPPPLIPPELQETDQPVVTVAPPAPAFSISGFGSTGSPTTLPVVFTLQSQFPRRWMLWMLNVPNLSSRDITNGEPPNLVVAPAGGTWNNPTLTVTVTLLGTFLATLAPGLHHFVLTAVNHRGKSHYAEAILTVTA